MSELRRLELECIYGQPFEEIVRRHAEEGMSIHATAKILQLNDSSFRAYLRRQGWEGEFKRQGTRPKRSPEEMRELGSRGGRAAARSAVAHAKRLDRHGVELDGCLDSIAGHARRRGLKPNMVYARLAAGDSLKDALRPKGAK